jgi:hypothetical protein
MEDMVNLTQTSLPTLILTIALFGCQQEQPSPVNPPPKTQPTPDASAPAAPFTPTKITTELPGLHNVIQASPLVYSGSEPHGAAAFASLQGLRVKTIVSVDGAQPAVALAREHGLRYVHVPIGYDGVPTDAAASLAAVVRTVKGPIYIHCHHGRHRGPAAAAIACQASGTLTHETARGLLELAGTGIEYVGLWRDVAAYQPPAADAPVPKLVEVAKVESLAAAMVQIDRSWDNLKLSRDAGWQAPAEHPDISLTQEALLLKESFHEAQRTLAVGYDEPFRQWLTEAERLAEDLEANLKAGARDEVTSISQALDMSCKMCHMKYRN